MNTLQKPVGSGFTAASTAEDVIRGIDLNGQVAIVTGGASGLGLETVRVLRDAGAHVIVPARSPAKAATALAGLRVEIETLDLLDPASVDAFADRFLASGRALPLLINSAGVMASPLTRDTRGYESQFATNHLGHFQLTQRLWPALCQAQGARVISVSSRGHRYSSVVFDDLHFRHREYEPWLAYGQSKTANILFALELDQRGRSEGIRAFSLHPGSIVATELGRHLPAGTLEKLGVIDSQGRPILDPLRQLKTVSQGASTAVWCATSPKLAGLGGVYCENNDIAVLVDDATPRDPDGADEKGNYGVMAYAVDSEAAEQLWGVSEDLIGLQLRSLGF